MAMQMNDITKSLFLGSLPNLKHRSVVGVHTLPVENGCNASFNFSLRSELLRRAVVSVSHDEVKHYLRSQAQTSADESKSSESLQDTAPARGHHVSTGGVCSLCDLLLFVHYSCSNHNSDC